MSLNLTDILTALVAAGFSVKQEGETIVVSNEDELDAFLVLQGDQIIAETLLFPEAAVADVDALNADILRTHQIFPLTTVAISNIDGEDYYTAFGALSADSKVSSVLVEVETLFNNVAGMLETYEDYIS